MPQLFYVYEGLVLGYGFWWKQIVFLCWFLGTCRSDDWGDSSCGHLIFVGWVFWSLVSAAHYGSQKVCGCELPPENVFVVGWWQRKIRDGRISGRLREAKGKS